MLSKLPPRCITQATSARLSGLVWSAAWLRREEPAAAASIGLTLSELMVRAGTAAYRACVRYYGAETRHWVILAGSGNNGGDGYVMARLAREEGRRVTVLAMPHSKPLPPEAAEARRRWHDMGGTVVEVTDATPLPSDADLVVDSLLGTGITGAPRGLCATLIARANALPARRFAVDVPSGLDAETGGTPGACFCADRTITFITLKPGLLTGQAARVVGGLTYDTLGLDAWLQSAEQLSAAACQRLSAVDAARFFGVPRSATAHKGSNGRTLLVGGARGFGGAIVMAAEAALAAGVGLARVLTDAEHVTPLLTRCPEAMYTAADTAHAPDADALRETLAWADVVVVGPGLGQGSFGIATVRAALENATARPEAVLILDADALNLLPAVLGSTPDPQRYRIPRSILTPHPGEAARLLGTRVDVVEADRLAAARRLAAVLGGTCILKGPGSVVCAYAPGVDGAEGATDPPRARCAIVDAGNAGMATAGMGDVLSGVLGGIAGQRIPGASDVFDVACAGALAHSLAADLAVEGRGTRGLRATELIPRVTEVVNVRAPASLVSPGGE